MKIICSVIGLLFNTSMMTLTQIWKFRGLKGYNISQDAAILLKQTLRGLSFYLFLTVAEFLQMGRRVFDRNPRGSPRGVATFVCWTFSLALFLQWYRLFVEFELVSNAARAWELVLH